MSRIGSDRPSPAPGKGFQTDTDISNSTPGSQRELQPWAGDGPESLPNGPRPNGVGGGKDSETFGDAGGARWDQFETNARLFGTKTSYQEEIYTTKLNRNGADYRKREKEADRLASEIMGQTSANAHVQEERNQIVDDWAKDEEEKYSGVQRGHADAMAATTPAAARNPNAYVPPSLRRGGAGGLPASAPRASLPANPTIANGGGTRTNGSLNGLSSPTPSQTPLPAGPAIIPSPATTPATTSTVPPSVPSMKTSEVSVPKPSPAEANGLAPPASTKEVKPSSAGADASTIAPPGTLAAASDVKETPRPGVVDSFRQFVGTELERVEAKKQSMAKTERDRQLAELKKFQANFKVPLPMPKDILPILAKDEEKQKAIEEQAAKALATAKAAAEARKTSKDSGLSNKELTPKSAPPKKIVMKIAEIPPFNPAKRKPAPLAVPPTAQKDVPRATSPTPSITSQTSQAVGAAKLNVKANAFVPNPNATAFKPGQSSTSPQTKVLSPSPTISERPLGAAQAVATPSSATTAPKNPFFRDQNPRRIGGVDPRSDFNPWRHQQVPSASTVEPAWPYTGRRSHASFSVPAGAPGGPGYEESGSPPPHVMVGTASGVPPMMGSMVPNFPQYYSHNQGMPQGMPVQMGANPMFSPPQHFQALSGHPGQTVQQHMGGPPRGPSGLPIYYQNGVPQHPQYMPHLQYNPNTPQRPGHVPHQPPNQSGMYFATPPSHSHSQMSMASPLQTPQSSVQSQLPFPGQPPDRKSVV